MGYRVRWDSLVPAVIEWQAECVLTLHRSERFTHSESLGSPREWAGLCIAYEHSYQEGCGLGSLASERDGAGPAGIGRMERCDAVAFQLRWKQSVI
jgi:hypothetical protein